MHSALDDSVANVTKALIRAGMINNTVIVFTSDNGGSMNLAPNWPLRYTLLSHDYMYSSRDMKFNPLDPTYFHPVCGISP